MKIPYLNDDGCRHMQNIPGGSRSVCGKVGVKFTHRGASGVDCATCKISIDKRIQKWLGRR